MKHTKKLLSIKNLKKYFPIAKSSIFQKEQYYVRANEDISIEIYEGETLGLVGESGCGKSTLGRTLIQLYDQTAGSTFYYGKKVNDLAPSYVAYTLKNAPKMLEKYKKVQAKADSLKAIVEAAADKASFIQIQQMNLAQGEAETAFHNIVRILGGFASLENPQEGANELYRKYEIEIAIFRNKNKNKLKKASLDLLISKKNDYKEKAKEDAKAKNKLSKYEQKITNLEKTIKYIDLKTDELRLKRSKVNEEIKELKSRHLDNPKFVEYEGYLDDGIDLSRLKYSEMRILRKDIQIIFQDPYSSLNPRMTVGQIIEEGLVTHNFFKYGSSQMKEYILEVMRQCGLQDYMIHRYPHQFSGGQRQRICIARALAVQPKFIVCDECVSALDVSIQSQIINLLEELKRKQDLTYLFISHDLSVVRYISDRIGVMYLGNIVELGSAEEVFEDPRHPYTVALLSSIPTTDPDSATKEKIILEGNIPSPVRPPEGCKFHTRCPMAKDICKRVPPQTVEVNPGHFVACHFLEKKLNDDGSFREDLFKTK